MELLLFLRSSSQLSSASSPHGLPLSATQATAKRGRVFIHVLPSSKCLCYLLPPFNRYTANLAYCFSVQLYLFLALVEFSPLAFAEHSTGAGAQRSGILGSARRDELTLQRSAFWFLRIELTNIVRSGHWSDGTNAA